AIRLPRAFLFLPARPAAMADAGGGTCRAWWSRDTVAVVTGANRGIGHSVAARLAEHGLTVVLTARDGERGEAAAAPLRDRGLAVVFRRLDVSDPASVAAFAAWLRDTVGGLDILVRREQCRGVVQRDRHQLGGARGDGPQHQLLRDQAADRGAPAPLPAIAGHQPDSQHQLAAWPS
uniref:Uncharacterized protein n=1 Tax=Aegilops tauschii subsp. strangulata TaxID=200361 RepID=A0A453CB58_AEGTS